MQSGLLQKRQLMLRNRSMAAVSFMLTNPDAGTDSDFDDCLVGVGRDADPYAYLIADITVATTTAALGIGFNLGILASTNRDEMQSAMEAGEPTYFRIFHAASN